MIKETDLYVPVKTLLIQQGFEVKAEIKNIDVLGVKDNLMVAVELKTKIAMKLIYQAIDRQKTVDQVYIAIPYDAIKKRGAAYKNLIHLLRRLELGLIFVKDQIAYVEIEATIYDRERSKSRYKRRKSQIQQEFRLRKSNNIGGTKDKRMTLYKEQVLEIASYILIHEKATPKEIKDFTHIEKTSSILQKNYDGYFLRISRGIYTIAPNKIEEIKAYKKISK